jgi:AcrR family transcriptional regulator
MGHENAATAWPASVMAEAQAMDEPADAPGSGRPPRRDRTRLALVRAGQKLFAERPVEIVSIDDIVQAAEVGRGSFYNHFADKDAFEREIVADARHDMEQVIAAAMLQETDAARRTVLGVCVSIRFAHEHPMRARLVARQYIHGGMMNSALNEGVLADISLGIRSGRFSVPTAEIGVLTVIGLANAAMIRSMELTDILAKTTLAQQVSACILIALGVDAREAAKIAAFAAEAGVRLG